MNSSNKLLLGIDIGTTGTKCSIYNLEGNIVASSYREYPMLHPHPDWTEQDPRVWWSCVCQNLKSCFEEQKVLNTDIAAIGVSCTNAVTLVDDQGEPLYNAIGLHDRRADHQLEWLEKRFDSKSVHERTGNRFSKGTCALTSMRWMIDERPELVQKACKFLMPSGFVIHHLTGCFSINSSRMALTAMGDIRKSQWDEELIEKAEVPRNLLPKIYQSTEIVGRVSKKAAAETGLAEGTPVTAGAVDTMAATLGAGAVNVGDLAITIGSSGRICYVSDEPSSNERIINSSFAFDGKYLSVQTTDNAGVSLRWFRDVFGDVVKSDDGESIYKRIDAAASKVAPSEKSIIYLPYLSGEKSPIWNTEARGVFFNIGLESDFGAFARSVMEGVAFSIRDCASIITDNVAGDKPIPLGGGVANSEFWCQIFADVLNRPIVKLENNETETLGDIIIAANSVGIHEIPKNFGKKQAEKGTILYPDADNVRVYNLLFSKYKELYRRIAPMF